MNSQSGNNFLTMVSEGPQLTGPVAPLAQESVDYVREAYEGNLTALEAKGDPAHEAAKTFYDYGINRFPEPKPRRSLDRGMRILEEMGSDKTSLDHAKSIAAAKDNAERSRCVQATYAKLVQEFQDKESEKLLVIPETLVVLNNIKPKLAMHAIMLLNETRSAFTHGMRCVLQTFLAHGKPAAQTTLEKMVKARRITLPHGIPCLTDNYPCEP